MHDRHVVSRGRIQSAACHRTRTPLMNSFAHTPVMLTEVLAWFDLVPSGLLIDATCGGAGHAIALLADRSDQQLLGLDRDPLAVDTATQRLQTFGDRAQVRHARFDRLPDEIATLRSERRKTDVSLPVVGILFDLGVSSAQFDLVERGFSYRGDAPLDMRMDTTTGQTAADIVNTAAMSEIRRIIRTYGDERFADRIARSIVARRPIETTSHLAEIVTAAIPAATRRTGGHPAKRTFQALRIEVNDELRVLERALDAALDALAPGGRCVVLSYHSGEDRIVKDRFRFAETGGCTCPTGLPCVCGALPRGRMVRRGVTRPTSAEVSANPRAASAVARVFERFGSATSKPATPLARVEVAGPNSSTRVVLDTLKPSTIHPSSPSLGPEREECQ